MASPGNVQESQLVKERYKDVELEEVITQLEKEKAELQTRLDFVEELVGPTEVQRKNFQQQLIAARSATLHAKRCGVAIPTRFVGRLDERWMRSRGMSERDCALLQRGCVTGQDGVPKDISLLGDPQFRPYDENLQPCWDARGGSLHMCLKDVRDRWGEEVALEVMKCAIELDKHDASRRLGIELPWSAVENRELQPAEIIQLMEREITRAEFAYEVQSDGGQSDAGPHSISSPSPDPDLVARDGIATPTLSLMESVITSGTITSAASPPPGAAGCADLDDEYDQERYGWSLADADIEQLLRDGKAGGSRSLFSSTQVSSVESSSEASDIDNDDEEEEEEVLLQLLEEEVTGSLGLLTPSPDLRVGSPL